MSAQIQLAQAILARQLVELDYEGTGSRKVEPYVLYESPEGQLLLSGYQRSGYSARAEPVGWKTFAVERLTKVTLLSETFQPRSDYNPGDATHYPRVVTRI